MAKKTCANSHFIPFYSSHFSTITNLKIELIYELTSWKGVLLEELVVPHLVKKFSALYEPQISFHATCSYSEPNLSSVCHPLIILQATFLISLPFFRCLGLSKGSL